jgi:hypothetical protein
METCHETEYNIVPSLEKSVSFRRMSGTSFIAEADTNSYSRNVYSYPAFFSSSQVFFVLVPGAQLESDCFLSTN